MPDTPQFKLRDVVEVTSPTRTYYALVIGDEATGLVRILDIEEAQTFQVHPEWCRLVDMTLIVEDGQWRLE